MDFKVYYGTEKVKIEVTDIIVENLKVNEKFIIPSGDHQRSVIFGDPDINTLKRIYIEKDKLTKSYSHNVIIEITMQSIKDNNFDLDYCEGYVEQVPQQMSQIIDLLVQTKQTLEILEIGFNGGHSSQLFLKNCNCNVVSFDLNEHSYVKHAKNYIDTIYPNRHTLITGDSNYTVLNYYHSPFDIIFIDGGHDEIVAKNDLVNCKRLAHKDTIIIFDDTVFNENWIAPWNIGPNKAWTEFINSGFINKIDSVDYQFGRGMSWGKYKFS